jgi:hypothetical protein
LLHSKDITVKVNSRLVEVFLFCHVHHGFSQLCWFPQSSHQFYNLSRGSVMKSRSHLPRFVSKIKLKLVWEWLPGPKYLRMTTIKWDTVFWWKFHSNPSINYPVSISSEVVASKQQQSTHSPQHHIINNGLH